jgi:hypothetical protein
MLSFLCLTLSNSAFYFLFGASAALSVLILFTSKKKITFHFKPYNNYSSTTNSISNEQPVVKKFFMNVFFLDRREFIRNIIRSKVPKSRPVIRALAKRAAIALLENGITEKVGSSLCTQIPERLGMMGVSCSASIAYTRAAYVCIEVSLHSLNLHQLLKVNAGIDRANAIMDLLARFSLPALTEYLCRSMLLLMNDRLMTMLPIQMKEKLYSKMSAEIEVITCTEEEQGPFLLNTIQQLDKAQAQATASRPAGDTSTTSAPLETSTSSSISHASPPSVSKSA